jgi:hypothetical protein
MIRTAIELSNKHQFRLRAIAVTWGWRGFSRVIEQAIDFYLDHHARAEIARMVLLERRGTWSVNEARKIAQTIIEVRGLWRKASA